MTVERDFSPSVGNPTETKIEREGGGQFIGEDALLVFETMAYHCSGSNTVQRKKDVVRKRHFIKI